MQPSARVTYDIPTATLLTRSYCARLAADVLASERRRDVDRYPTVRALASSLIDVYFEVRAFSSSGEP